MVLSIQIYQYFSTVQGNIRDHIAVDSVEHTQSRTTKQTSKKHRSADGIKTRQVRPRGGRVSLKAASFAF